MAADDLLAVNLPPIISTGNTSPRGSRQENGDTEKSKKDKKDKKDQKDQKLPTVQSEQSARDKTKTDVDFEPPEHELDRFA